MNVISLVKRGPGDEGTDDAVDPMEQTRRRMGRPFAAFSCPLTGGLAFAGGAAGR